MCKLHVYLYIPYNFSKKKKENLNFSTEHYFSRETTIINSSILERMVALKFFSRH